MAAAKTTPTKKKPTKKVAVKAAVQTKAQKTARMRSFHCEPSDTDFLTFRITRQTIYWLILSAIVLALGIWIIQLQSDIQGLYDAIEANNAQLEMITSERTPTQP